MGGSSAGSGGGSGGNTGADAGFFISEQEKKDKKKKEQQKINDSLAGESDYQGDVNPQKKPKKKTPVVTSDNNNGGDGGQSYGAESGNNTITQVTKTAPTEAEVSQSTTTEAEPDTEANRLLKIKKKGRSRSIMTSAKGVTKTSSDYSLGKPSLLGRV